MAKLASAKKVGIPRPATLPSDVTHLVVYYGPTGFTPDYAQGARHAIPIALVPVQDVNGVPHLVFDTAQIPAQQADSIDVYFTLADDSDQEEGDFSPKLAVPFDRTPPARLAAPVILD